MNHVKQHGKKKERSTWAANAYQEGGHVGFCKDFVYEVRTAAQFVACATACSVAAARAGVDASASVGAGAEAVATAGDRAPCRAGAGFGAGAVSMPNPPVDQTNPLTRSVPNPQLDQTEVLPLSVLEQLSVLDLCETTTIVSGLL